VAQQVTWAEQAGLDVILDLHWSDQGNLAISPAAAQQCMADVNSVTFWTQVATQFMNDGHVSFELYNEPHDVAWSVWLNGGMSESAGVSSCGANFMVVGMQTLYNTVRATGAKNLVIIGGLQYAYDLSGVANTPVSGYNIVYATHPYNQPNKQPANWPAGFGYLTTMYPVMATEFGDVTSCSGSYNTSLISYAGMNNMSWSAWAWFDVTSGNPCSFPALISDWAGTPTTCGAVVQTALEAF
jgi:aryl-phospho-beta-D-glucosidase BglC (GH1 family)